MTKKIKFYYSQTIKDIILSFYHSEAWLCHFIFDEMNRLIVEPFKIKHEIRLERTNVTEDNTNSFYAFHSVG